MIVCLFFAEGFLTSQNLGRSIFNVWKEQPESRDPAALLRHMNGEWA